MKRTRCLDPRCGKLRADQEDFDKHNDELCTARAPCLACRELCWLDFNGDAHVNLPERRKGL